MDAETSVEQNAREQIQGRRTKRKVGGIIVLCLVAAVVGCTVMVLATSGGESAGKAYMQSMDCQALNRQHEASHLRFMEQGTPMETRYADALIETTRVLNRFNDSPGNISVIEVEDRLKVCNPG